MTRSRVYWWIPSLLLLLAACESDALYEENRDLENGCWLADNSEVFEFDIVNRNLKYDVIIHLRNNLSYSYRNIYLNYSLLDESGSIVEENLVDFDLFDQAGKPLGKGTGDIYSNELPLFREYGFDEPGRYTLSLTQYMRKDTLDHLVSVGIRVESSEVNLTNDPQE